MEESRGDYSLAFLTQCQRCSHAMLPPASVYCPMRPGVCAKFQFSPPHQWNGRARASPGLLNRDLRSRTFAGLRCSGITRKGNIICISRDNPTMHCNVTLFRKVLENVERIAGASVRPRAWFCLRGRNWYFIEFSRPGTWLFAHKTKCWCQSKNRMSLYILIFTSIVPIFVLCFTKVCFRMSNVLF